MNFKKIILLLSLFIWILPFGIVNATSTENNVNISAEAAILIDTKTGIVLYEKNANEKKYPASTTKILTSIIIIENCNINDSITITKSAISAIPSGYSSAYLTEGEQMSIKDLLTLFLVHSANDAGYILAEYFSNSIENFANVMNQKANEIGCKNSHFTNPSGIHNAEHFSTAYDLSLIANYCMKNETFRSIVRLPKCTISATNKFGIRQYSNTNELLNPLSKYFISDCIGIKTGYTKEAKNCLISCFSKDNLELLSVVLGSSNSNGTYNSRFVDTHALYNYGYTNYSRKVIAHTNDIITTIQIKNASKETKELNLLLENDITALVKQDETIENPQISLEEKILAPIDKNTKLGTVTYSINGIQYTENLVAANDVKPSYFLLILLLTFLVIFFVIMIIIFLNFKKKKRKKKKSKYDNKY